jgi:hypothetical protein
MLKTVSIWWVTYPSERWKKFEVVSLLWVTYPVKKKCEVVSLLWVTYPNERWWSDYDGWPTRMEKCDLRGKKTWQAKSWQDKADKRHFLIAGLTWTLLLMTGLISSFLWDFPTGRVHLIPFLFQDLNRWFFVIIDSMILSVHNLAGLHWGFSCNNSKICAMLWG